MANTNTGIKHMNLLVVCLMSFVVKNGLVYTK